ncbi:MAG: hypothetical protein ABFD89_04230, partial [Bryobacteraceae bacterium]
KQLCWRFSLLIVLALPTLGFVLGQPVPKSRLDTMPRQYAGPRLLGDLVNDLEAKFGWTISLEEPPWASSQGIVAPYPKRVNYTTDDRFPEKPLWGVKPDFRSALASKWSSAQERVEASLNAQSKRGGRTVYLARQTEGLLQTLRGLYIELSARFGQPPDSLREPPWIRHPGPVSASSNEERIAALLRNRRMDLPKGRLDLTNVFTVKYSSARELIQACLNAYSEQGNQGGYIVRESKGMLQIIPDPRSPATQIAGQSLLDWEIEVPVEKRYPDEHVSELCRAVRLASGADFGGGYFGWRFYEVYLANTRQKVAWGCSRMKARAALEDFLSRSMTTLTWAVTCVPKEAGHRLCHFSLRPLALEVQTSKGRERRPLYFDRGWHFPYPPPPPPPEPPEK